MGKKKDKKQKGKGAEKTAIKTERNADKKSKKLLKDKGEDDIEALIAEFQEKDRKRLYIGEEKSEPPSPRCNMSLTPHPEKEELVMFGGEYFNGNKTFMYNDLYFYNIKNNTWSILKTPTVPPPRCGHQSVAMRQGGGQLWVFGGEFASPTQSQFYHYKDMWLYHFTDKKWEKISVPNGPSARSGHRMVACKKQIIVFGGFHDNTRDYKYFNDLYAFNVESYSWTQLLPSGPTPSPRSACVMATTQDQNYVVIYGGYSKEKVKKDIDKGKIHVDMYKLSPEGKAKEETIPSQWKWISIKQSGVRPSPRCGCTLVATPGNRAIVFGGVFDEEEDEEELKGKFYNDMYSFELDKGKWHEVYLRGKKENKEKRKRRHKRVKVDDDNASDTGDVSGDSEFEMEDEVENLKVTEDGNIDAETSETAMSEDIGVNAAGKMDEKSDNVCKVTIGDSETQESKAIDDGIFTVTVGRQRENKPTTSGALNQAVTSDNLFWPCTRMNTLLAVKNGILYLYGGMTEDGDKQLTYSDFYSLDLHKLDEWNTIIANEADKIVWEESSDDSDDEVGAKGGKRKHSHDSSVITSNEGDSESDDSELGEAPDVKEGESINDYFSRNKDYWMIAADEVAEKENLDVTTKQLKKAAFKMAEENMASAEKKSC